MLRNAATAPLLLLVAALVLAACKGEDGPEAFVERATQLRFEASDRDFWSTPLPSSLRKGDEGTLKLMRYPTRHTPLVQAWLKTADERSNEGWGLTNGVFFPVSGAVDAGSLPGTPDASRAADASVYLVDIDPDSPERGRRFPLDVTFTAQGGVSRPDNLLALVPVFGFVRRPNTLYAAVVTDAVRDANGEPLGRSPGFHAAFTAGFEEGGEGADPRAAEELAPLRAWVTEQQQDPARVVAASVFRTLDPERALARLVDFVEGLPAPSVAAGWEPAEEYDDYRVFTSSWLVPNVQAGDRPGHGAIQWGADGKPVQSGAQQARLVITVPKTPMPADGFPLLIYLHGSGGEAFEGINRGPTTQEGPPPQPPAELGSGLGPAAYLARRGVALLGFDFPLHGTRRLPPDETGLDFYSLFGSLDGPYNVRQTLDNMPVAVMEFVYLTRLIESLNVDGAKYDADRLSAMGHSMGSTLGIVAAGVDPRVDGWVFSGAGGMLIEVAHSATYPVHLKPYLELLLELPTGETLTRDHPLLHVFQNLWDNVDPVARARRVAQEPFAGRGPRPYLMTVGVVDGYFHPLAQQAVAVSLGGPVVGPTIEDTLPAAMALAERPGVEFGVSGNLNGVTAGAVHYTSPHELGHYIVFNDDGPRSQVLCFVEGVGSAAGPRIVAPHDAATLPCP